MYRTPRSLKLIPFLVGVVFLTGFTAPALAGGEVGSGRSVVPEETEIFARITEDITSKKRETNAGDVIVARVEDDVLVDGQVVVERGADLYLRVENAKKAKMFGRKGRIELTALSVRAVDGNLLPLDGLYDTKGKGRKVVTGVLTVAVAWPFAFLRGKNAKIPEGTIIATRLHDDAEVRLPARLAAK